MPLMARLQDNAVANGSGGVLDVAGYTSVGIQITGLNGNGTISLEGTINGTDWVPFDAEPVVSGASTTSVTTTGAWTANVAGFRFIRAPLSGYSGGTPVSVFAFASEAVSNASASSGGSEATGGVVDQGAPGSDPWLVAPLQLLSTTATLTNIAASATSVQLLVANAARFGASIVNDADRVLRVKPGATASTTSFSKILGLKDTNGIGGQWDVDANYTGRVDGIWDSGPTGAARVTEYT
jgi:hypothetical protein